MTRSQHVKHIAVVALAALGSVLIEALAPGGPLGHFHWAASALAVVAYAVRVFNLGAGPPAAAALVVMAALGLFGCATAKTCAAPLSNQMLTDGASVLACAAIGESLATCEAGQIANEGAQLTQDVLMCAEAAVVNASKGKHMTAETAAAMK